MCVQLWSNSTWLSVRHGRPPTGGREVRVRPAGGWTGDPTHAGVAGIQIEDQTSPKRCGHFDDKNVVPTAEIFQKIRVATDARADDDFAIIARTDARAVTGLDDAIDRCFDYVDAGADVIFFEAPRSEAELRRVAAALGDEVPLLANMTEGGETPLFTAEQFAEFGFDVVLYPATGFKAAAKALDEVYAEIAETGTQAGVMDDLLTWDERNELTGLAEITALERRYTSE